VSKHCTKLQLLDASTFRARLIADPVQAEPDRFPFSKQIRSRSIILTRTAKCTQSKKTPKPGCSNTLARLSAVHPLTRKESHACFHKNAQTPAHDGRHQSSWPASALCKRVFHEKGVAPHLSAARTPSLTAALINRFLRGLCTHGECDGVSRYP
jgi:hypothetical protein